MDQDLLEQNHIAKPSLETAATEIASLLRDVTIPEYDTSIYDEQLDYVALMILWLSNAKYDEILESCTLYDECLLKLVECWIENCPDASWRWLIWKFDHAENKEIADRIRHYAEPLTDPTLTCDNVLRVLPEAVDEWWLHTYFRVACEPETKAGSIKWWLDYSPFASWEELAGRLYYVEHCPKALKLARQSFDYTPDPTLTLLNICTAFKDVKNWERWDCEELLTDLDLPDSLLPDTDSTADPSEYRKAIFKLFLENHPAPSWQSVARAAYLCDADSAVEVILRKYVRGLNLQKLCTQAISSFVPSEDVDELPLPKRMKLMISSDNDS